MAAFEIDGRDYPVPSVFSLTMGEAQVLYDYSGYTLEQFVPVMPGEDDSHLVAQIKNPAFQRAMVHVAYQRGNPELARDEVAALVDTVDMLSVIAALYGKADADPSPVSQSKPPILSAVAPQSTDESSGRPSPTSADQPEGTRAPTGATA